MTTQAALDITAAPTLEPWQLAKITAMIALEGCTNYKVECDQVTAEGFFARAETYNGIPDDGLVGFAQAIDHAVPRMQFRDPRNPNNGQRAHKWEIGNEGSRVVYLVIGLHFMPDLPGKAADALERTLIRIARQANADEADVASKDEHHLVMRFWWD